MLSPSPVLPSLYWLLILLPSAQLRVAPPLEKPPNKLAPGLGDRVLPAQRQLHLVPPASSQLLQLPFLPATEPVCEPEPPALRLDGHALPEQWPHVLCGCDPAPSQRLLGLLQPWPLPPDGLVQLPT